jgi:hypothetical protein
METRVLTLHQSSLGVLHALRLLHGPIVGHRPGGGDEPYMNITIFTNVVCASRHWRKEKKYWKGGTMPNGQKK